MSPRAIEELLIQTQLLQENYEFTLTLSILEIYNEAILDLLSNGNSSTSSSSGNSGKDGKDGREKLEVRQTSEGNHVVGLTEIQVSDDSTVGTTLGCHYLCYLSL